MMARLIDANELIEHMFLGTEYDKTVDDGMEKTEAMCKAFKCGWNDALASVMDYAPTVDAVEVVKCKDCIYSYPFSEEALKNPLRVGEWHCEFWYAEMHEDDYCSCGKRREDGKIG